MKLITHGLHQDPLPFLLIRLQDTLIIAEHKAESMLGIESASTIPVSEVGLCVTHWASGSSFAEN